jgi:hypothetical protein
MKNLVSRFAFHKWVNLCCYNADVHRYMAFGVVGLCELLRPVDP